MLKFRNLLSFPSYYSKRNPKLNTLIPTLDKVDISEEYTLITGTVDSAGSGKQYGITIFANTKDFKFGLDSEVKVSCTCDSFKYEFSYSLNKVGSLLNPETYVIKPPTKKNRFNTPAGCKHIISFSKFVNVNRNKLI